MRRKKVARHIFSYVKVVCWFCKFCRIFLKRLRIFNNIQISLIISVWSYQRVIRTKSLFWKMFESKLQKLGVKFTRSIARVLKLGTIRDLAWSWYPSKYQPDSIPLQSRGGDVMLDQIFINSWSTPSFLLTPSKYDMKYLR